MTDVARADAFLAMLPLPEVYRVGGSVRDELLWHPAKDADYVVTGLQLDELERVLDTAGAEVSPLELRGGGPQIGVRARVFDIGSIEICLPRRERSTGVGRHSFDIEVDANMKLSVDAGRRDFTFNALYRNVRGGLVHDPLGIGKRDLNWGTIETTGWDSFAEDPLRTLRALRFVSTLGFRLSPATEQQMSKHAQAVTGLTRKGVSSTALDELCKILMGDHPIAALRLARDTGVLPVLLPELEAMIGYEQESEYHDRTVDEHTFEAIQAAVRLDAPLRVRLALLFHDCGKPATAWTDERGHKHYYARKGAGEVGHELMGMTLAEAAMFRLNTPRRLRYDVLTLIERHMTQFSISSKPMKVRELRAELGDEMLRDLLLHKRCDALGKGPGASGALAALDHAVHLLDDSIRLGVPRAVTELAIGGEDLLGLGLKGWRLGRAQKQLLHEVMATPGLNERGWLLRRAGKLAGQLQQRPPASA